MLVRLFRWRCDGGGTFGIGGLVWKQVGWRPFRGFDALSLLICFHKGVLWLLLATIAEVPPAVSPVYSLEILIFARPCNVVGVHYSGSKQYSRFLSSMSTRNSEMSSTLPEIPGLLDFVRP